MARPVQAFRCATRMWDSPVLPTSARVTRRPYLMGTLAFERAASKMCAIHWILATPQHCLFARKAFVFVHPRTTTTLSPNLVVKRCHLALNLTCSFKSKRGFWIQSAKRNWTMNALKMTRVTCQVASSAWIAYVHATQRVTLNTTNVVSISRAYQHRHCQDTGTKLVSLSVAKKSFNDACTNDIPCNDARNLTCLGGVCKCPAGLFYEANKNINKCGKCEAEPYARAE